MRKYLYIYKATLIENLQYFSNVFLGVLNFFMTMFVMVNLWEYMYSDSSQIINGYSMNQMIWYVLLAEVIWYGTRNKSLTKQISEDIKTGNIAYNINKPYNYIFFIISKHFGEITLRFVTFLGVGVLVGRIFIGKIVGFSIVNIPLIAITMLLGIFINSILKIMISIVSFWIEDSGPLHWIYDKFILLFGTLFPIDMFPRFLRPIMQCTPIFVITYGPVRLIINFTIKSFIKIIIAQLVYCVVLVLSISFLYSKGVKKLNVNGG